MSLNPPRRFAPTPIEQTTKSSRLTDTPDEPNKKPRRFAPLLVEETAKSTKDVGQQAVQSQKPKPRRFAPQPVEQTTKSSKDAPKKNNDSNETKSKPRRFAPQMVEETQKSSKDRPADNKLHVKFKPEVVSTTYRSNRTSKSSQDSDSMMDIDDKAPRKFTPILLDTARRTRRAGDDKPAISDSHKTEYAYHLHHAEHWKRVNAERAGPSSTQPLATLGDDDDEDMEDAPPPAMSGSRVSKLREAAPLDGSAPKRPSCLTPGRQHSFRMPDLDTIESSESERSTSPSPASSSPTRDGSPITATASESSYGYFKHATRIRESFDENYTHYLLDIERQKARQRLEQQALAAYPNPDFGYEAPDHYINNDADSDDFEIEDRPVTWDMNEDDDMEIEKPKRDSSESEGDWEKKEMQKHAEKTKQQRAANKATAKASESPWWKPPPVDGHNDDDDEPRSEFKSMRNGARPPMLGGDIVFPRCPSPEPTRFDVTQGAAALRNQMSNEAARKKARKDDEGGLWHQDPASPPTSPSSPVASVKKPSSGLPKSSKAAAKGLWGGFCVDKGEKNKPAAGLAPPTGPTGLMTPRVEAPNPYELAFQGQRQAPSTPTKKSRMVDMSKLDAALASEKEFEEMLAREYPDSFITQVYNYLSLGYPSIARDFDEELAKISRFSIAELRQDDESARHSPKGYIRLGEDFEGGGGAGVTEQKCVRWQALKKYMREWARQEKDMVKTDEGNFGTGARRGSWAF